MNLDLSTRYGGLLLQSPVVVGSCPLAAEEMMRVAMVSAGAGALVLPSLFEEQVLLWNEQHGFASGSAQSKNRIAPDVLQRSMQMQIDTVCESGASYLSLVRRASSEASIPIIASLNGESGGNWSSFAVELSRAGAAGIEWHVRQPSPGKYADPLVAGDAIIETAADIASAIDVPLFLKLGRNFIGISQFAKALSDHVQGLTLYGRSPRVDIDLGQMQLITRWELTQPGNISLALESMIHLRRYEPKMSLAASGGVGSSEDLIKVLLAGADVAMVTSAVYRDGPTIIGNLLEGLRGFMCNRRWGSLDEMKANRLFVFDSDLERTEYIKAMSISRDSGLGRTNAATVQGDPWGHPRLPK